MQSHRSCMAEPFITDLELCQNDSNDCSPYHSGFSALHHRIDGAPDEQQHHTML